MSYWPSGYVKIAIENGPFMVDLPIKNGDFPWLCKRLPEGIIDNIMEMYPFGSLTVCEVEYLYKPGKPSCL